MSIRRHIYAELHEFLAITIREPLQKAVKNKRDVIAGLINSVIDTCSIQMQYAASTQTLDSGGSHKKNKKERAASTLDLRHKIRSVPPSFTQVCWRDNLASTSIYPWLP